MKNNIYKEQTCIKYRELLNIIGIISKGYILQKQLIQYMILLDIANSEYKARKIIEELEYAELIKKINFADTKNKIILLRKFGIRFLQGKKGSGSVGAISTCSTSKRYYKSIFINHYVLLNLKAASEFLYTAKVKTILVAMQDFKMNLIMDNIDFYKILKSYGFDEFLVDNHIEKIEIERKIRKEILINAKNKTKTNAKNNTTNLTSKEKRAYLMLNATLDTLKRKDCYFRLFKGKDTIIANIYYFDYCNTQNVVKIVENIALIVSFMEQAKVRHNINFTIFCWDLVAIENIKIKLNNKDYIQQQLNEFYGIRVPLTDILTVKYINLDMYKNYLTNVKKIIDF